MVCVLAAIGLGRLQSNFLAVGQTDPVSRVMRATFAKPADLLSGGLQQVRIFMTRVWSVNRLVAENERLQGEVVAARDSQRLEEIRQTELQNLRDAIGLPSFGRNKVPAHVVGFFPGDNRIKLSVGASRGVKAGQPVVTAKGLVGQVSTVERDSCFVTLVTSPRLNVSALLASNFKYVGLLHGETPTSLVMELIDTSAVPREGDLVVTSGMSEAYPRGIVIGYVKEVRSSLDSGISSASVVPRVDFNDLVEVVVLT